MKNKAIYKKIGVVALPIIIQNIIDASVNSADYKPPLPPVVMISPRKTNITTPSPTPRLAPR